MESHRAPITIRECREADVGALEAHMPSGRSAFHAKRFARQADGSATYLIAWVDGVPAGHLLLKWTGSQDEPVRRHVQACPEINALNVRPDLQGRGIGTALVREAEDRVRRGHVRIGLAVGVENAGARRLYERLGYRDWGHGEFVTGWDWVDDDGVEQAAAERCVYMVKDLSPSDV